MTDQELLERAASIAGIGLECRHPGHNAYELYDGDLCNPLDYDGDAFRLMVETRLDLHHGENEYGEGIVTVVSEATCWANSPVCDEHDIAGLRRAIVRAAAMMEGAQ